MADTILVIEDEEGIAGLIQVYLENENFRVLKAFTGKAGIALAAHGDVSLALLDLMLPDMDGFQVCRALRQSHTFPIIMLTAKDRPTDKIAGLTLGADDYMTKPFLPLELMARVKAQLRRHQKYDARGRGGPVLEAPGLVVDEQSHTCQVDGRPVALTPTEFQILTLLMRSKGRPVSSEELYRGVWGEAYYEGGNNTVMVHIRHLREKLGGAYIVTVWGVGYKIEA